MSFNALQCERCGRDLESDDAISIIEGICGVCRRSAVLAPVQRTPPVAMPPIAIPSRPRAPSAPPPSAYRETPKTPPSIDIEIPAAPQPATPPPEPAAPPASRSLPAQYYESAAPRLRHRRRDLAIGVSLGLVLTIALTGYFFWQRRSQPTLAFRARPAMTSDIDVTLTIKPSWATVTLDGKPIGPADENGKLTLALPADGEAMRWIEVSAKGYHAVRKPLTVFAGVQDVTVALVQQPFELAVASQPPEAEVWINGALKGYTPLTVTMMPETKAMLTVKRPGYQQIVREVIPPATGEPLTLDLKLDAAAAALRIETEPSGARIAVDGKVRGVSPLTTDVDPQHLGKNVAITASLDGFEPATSYVHIPPTTKGEAIEARLVLEESQIEVRISTDPPGGRVVIDKNDLGEAPVVARFPTKRAGSSVVVEASRGGAYHGRSSIKIPAGDRPASFVVPMKFSGQRVAFILWPRCTSRPDHSALVAHFNEQIHRLRTNQHFATITITDDGITAWPEGGETLPASSEQKVRAYDLARFARPTQASTILPALESALACNPTAIWIFAGSQFNRAELASFDDQLKGRDVNVHLVSAAAGRQHEWLAQWASDHGGTLTVLGRDALPAVAQDTDPEEE